jgi:4-amino-4-deoxy-L-arabinose transferase-like glycosyltransferase
MLVWSVIVAGAFAVGVALRVWVLASPLGALESDEAIVGLMAIEALHGDVSVFYWGALYGGSQEALLTAAVFWVTGSSVLVLKLVSLAIYGIAALLVWLVGRRTVGEPSARIGAALFWVWPPFFVWWSTKSRAYFGSGLVIGLAALLLALRLSERDSKRDAALLGFVLGVGVWATLQSMLLAIPALAWLAFRRPRAYRLVPLALPGAVLGASPWLFWNVTHGWNAVLPSSVAGAESTYVERFADLFAIVLPTWLGLRAPYSHDWLLGPVVGIALTAGLLVAFVVLALRRPRRLEPLIAVALAFPFLYSATSFAFFVGEPRYLVFLAPIPALLLGRALVRGGTTATVAGLSVAAALSVAGLVTIERQGLFAPTASDRRVPADLGPALDVLERAGERRVLADYWIAYRITFESGEQIIATSTGHWRYAPHHRLVHAARRPAWVFVTGSRAELQARGRLLSKGYRREAAGGFAVYTSR